MFRAVAIEHAAAIRGFGAGFLSLNQIADLMQVVMALASAVAAVGIFLAWLQYKGQVADAASP